MEKYGYLVSSKYPLKLISDDEFSHLPALFEEIDFRPRKATLKVRKVNALWGLFEVQTNSIIFEE